MLLQGLLDLLGGAREAPPAKTPAPTRPERPRQVLLVKHQSAFETFLMPAIMPHALAYVFK